MTLYRVINIIDGEPTVDKPLAEILADLKEGGALQTLTPAEYITKCQIAWWKGILLPALSNSTGDTEIDWEVRLKMAVMRDEFQPEYVEIGGVILPIYPSITTLSVKKMNLLIKGSVSKCHDWGEKWVTLPDSSLRKEI